MTLFHPAGAAARRRARSTALGLPLTLLFASLAFAEGDAGGIASLIEVRGNVLVSRNSSLASASEAIRLLPGTRVLTTANSAAVVKYDGGCRVDLKENQRFEIDVSKGCAGQVHIPPAGSRPSTLRPIAQRTQEVGAGE